MKFRSLAILSLLALLSSCNRDWLDYSPIDIYSAKIDYDDTNAPKHLSVAAATIEPSKTNKLQTLEAMKSMIIKIKNDHPDIQVIVFGELILGWYYDKNDPEAYQRSIAENIPGEATDYIKSIAIANDVNIVFGLTELENSTNKLYNSQVLIRTNGDIVKYRKRNLNQTDLDNKLSAGSQLVTAEIDGVKTALFVCSDMQSKSITKEITSAKVDVILHSLTTTTDLNPDISYVGMQMNTWIVFANRFGNEDEFEYTGFSHIINPVGTICNRTVGKNTYSYRRIGIFNRR